MKNAKLFIVLVALAAFAFSCKKEVELTLDEKILKVDQTWDYYENDSLLGTVEFKRDRNVSFDGVSGAIKWEVLGETVEMPNIRVYAVGGSQSVADIYKMDNWVLSRGEVFFTVVHNNDNEELRLMSNNIVGPMRSFDLK